MPTPLSYRPEAGSIPQSPGVYRFTGADGKVLYVGKAKNLRSRLSQYFQDPSALHPRTQSMLQTAAGVDWTVVGNEVEALQLEYAWIKEFDPRFNVKYRDDKSYPYLAVTLDEEFPRVQVMRGAKRKGVRYFGPYTHAWAIRDTLDHLLRVFPVRSCSRGVFRRSAQIGRPCLLGDIGKCSAPCVGRVDAAAHRALVEDLCAFLAGDSARFIRALSQEMAQAAAAQEYERAARLRDDLGALERALSRSVMVLPDDTDADVFAVADDPLEAAVQVFHVRGGRIRGQRGWIVEKSEELTPADLLGELLALHYGAAERSEIPREVLAPFEPADAAVLGSWLTEKRGVRVEVRVPRRGDKKALLATVGKNAAESLHRHRLRRSSDLTTRSTALREIQEQLDLPEAPLRIECFDVSNLGASDVVASMVVFEDGLPRKGEYRHFAVKGSHGSGDTGAMEEVLSRRLHALAESAGRASSSAYPPSLLVVDGGAPQVAAAARALAAAGRSDLPVIGLAKRLEEVWLPDSADPVVLPRTSEGLYLLQRVRDEAHRFAIGYHRKRRGRRVTSSALDAVPGLGEVRRKALLRHFGSLRRVRAASVEEIAEVPGIGPRTATAVLAALMEHDTPAAPAVNTATGEIIETDVEVSRGAP